MLKLELARSRAFALGIFNTKQKKTSELKNWVNFGRLLPQKLLMALVEKNSLVKGQFNLLARLKKTYKPNSTLNTMHSVTQRAY